MYGICALVNRVFKNVVHRRRATDTTILSLTIYGSYYHTYHQTMDAIGNKIMEEVRDAQRSIGSVFEEGREERLRIMFHGTMEFLEAEWQNLYILSQCKTERGLGMFMCKRIDQRVYTLGDVVMCDFLYNMFATKDVAKLDDSEYKKLEKVNVGEMLADVAEGKTITIRLKMGADNIVLLVSPDLGGYMFNFPSNRNNGIMLEKREMSMSDVATLLLAVVDNDAATYFEFLPGVNESLRGMGVELYTRLVREHNPMFAVAPVTSNITPAMCLLLTFKEWIRERSPVEKLGDYSTYAFKLQEYPGQTFRIKDCKHIIEPIAMESWTELVERFGNHFKRLVATFPKEESEISCCGLIQC